jgi:hypothetical protein
LFFCHFIAWNFGLKDAKSGSKGAETLSVNEMIAPASR